MPDPHKALLRCFGRELPELCGSLPPEVQLAASRPWASATFTGAHHRFTLLFTGDTSAEDARRFAWEIEDYEFDLPGHLVADVRAEPSEPRECGAAVTLEMLTIEIC